MKLVLAPPSKLTWSYLLVRPLAFGTACIGATWAAAFYYDSVYPPQERLKNDFYLEPKERRYAPRDGAKRRRRFASPSLTPPTPFPFYTLPLAHNHTTRSELVVWLDKNKDKLDRLPVSMRVLCAWKGLLDEGQRAMLSITAVNAAILLAWKVPRLQMFMSRNFLHAPLRGATQRGSGQRDLFDSRPRRCTPPLSSVSHTTPPFQAGC